MENKTKIHKAKKSLGQNFLKSVPALTAIVKSGEINNADTILEIGPGKGALTEKLLEVAGKVIAVEKDRDLLEFLQTKFSEEIKNKKLILINEDILEYNLKIKNYKIIANIPYNITGAILKKFLTDENQPERMVLMVQNEVAKRIVARDGSESILSISVKAYGNPKIIMKVPARYFSPAPKVDSAIIAITNINRNNFHPIPTSPLAKGEGNSLEEKFWKIVKAGFAHKRKMLMGNLKEFDKKIDWLSILTKLNISIKSRAEELTLNNWLEITKMVQ
ncbi:MAG: 16S rRNA (adenine(1518)-N(6)/adenine(1519)-N(6))-dimethyltransferase RsmA [Candidatus Nomurabacteria bacterium]|nr:16S rRNA (adenine(1518)-N(6)/adenine(1519)-N(6))-dimethyltransferase RsmA [Candidatus Nomurabacteria bacterium]